MIKGIFARSNSDRSLVPSRAFGGKYGQVWGVEMQTGRDAGKVCNFPSLLLQGQGGGSGNVSLRRSEGPPA